MGEGHDAVLHFAALSLAELVWVPEKPELATMIADAWAFASSASSQKQP